MTVLQDSLRGVEVADGKPHPGRRMTEREFVKWADEDTDAEWVDGEIVMMAPISGEHDEIGFFLRSLLYHFVSRGDLGITRGPEFAVRLGSLRRRRQPDVLFVSKARLTIVQKNHVEGAPDLIMEVVSP